MNRKIAVFLVMLILLQGIPVYALTPDEAKELWLDSRQISREKRENYVNARLAFNSDKSLENRNRVVDTGKETLHASLNEAEAWLIWKRLEVNESVVVSQELKKEINNDVINNLNKIDKLRKDVDSITNQIELGVVFTKMVVNYLELVTDVARNSGKAWVQIGNNLIDLGEKYEKLLRSVAEKMNDNQEIIGFLDSAKSDLDNARKNINNAEESFKKVVLPGQPLINFAQGNNYLNIARTNLISAHSNLELAYVLIVRGEK